MVCLLTLLLAGCGPVIPDSYGTSEEVSAEAPEGSSEDLGPEGGSDSVGSSEDLIPEGGSDSVGGSEDLGPEGGSDSVGSSEEAGDDGKQGMEETLPEDGIYTSRDEVALYIHLYGHLPSNFITKKEAGNLGWEGGSLEPYAPGKCIGGNRFGNYEGLLPEKEGRTYTECDIDTLGADSRGARRIVFSNDGLIYYTEDHYESFELLYGEE